jgi:hypothetical protein
LGGAVLESFERTFGGTPGYSVVQRPSKFDITLDDIKRSAAKLGLGKYSVVTKLDDVLRVRPPNAQASLGATSDPRDGTVLLGAKASKWNVVLDIAQYLWGEFEKMDLTWEWLTPGRAHLLCQDLDLAFAPLLRLDGKPLKPRIIHAGSSPMYAIESAVATAISPSFKATDGFAYRVGNTASRFRSMSDCRIINCDFSNYDASQYWGYQVLLYKALGQLYSIPEWLIVPICAYNIAAPIWVPEWKPRGTAPVAVPEIYSGRLVPTGRVSRVWVLGKARSGSGIFPIVNSLGSFAALDHVGQHLGLGAQEFGQTFGDNSAWPMPEGVGAADWATNLREMVGFFLKPEESVVSRGEVCMLRRLIDLETGSIQPLIGSRARNALLPKLEEPNDVPPELVAVIYRAQTLELFLAANEDQHYRPLLEYWLRVICPSDRLMLERTDKELLDALPTWAAAHDSLDWVKRARGIVDTLDIAQVS